VKGPSDRHVILEEYVDGIHFIGSLSIAHKVDTIYEIPDHIQLLDKKSLTKRFNELFLMMDTLNKPSGIKR
jgi:dimeric dUTPase (all-alpha-NTP-PPase superfamily)